MSNLEGLSNFTDLEQLQQVQQHQQNLTEQPTNNNFEDFITRSILEQSFAGAAQFSCKQMGCDKSYTTVTGLNNHLKK